MPGRAPLSDEQILEAAAKTSKSNSWIRKEYLSHRGFLYSIDRKLRLDGVAVPQRAWQLWSARRGFVELALARMKHPAERYLLENRNVAIWGAPRVPTFERLLEEARRKGLNESGQMSAVIDWALRPDLYEYVPGRPVSSRRPRQQPERRPKILGQKISWNSVLDPREPLIGKVRAKRYKIRINDFPEEALFSLADEGGTLWDFDDWPTLWTKVAT